MLYPDKCPIPEFLAMVCARLLSVVATNDKNKMTVEISMQNWMISRGYLRRDSLVIQQELSCALCVVFVKLEWLLLSMLKSAWETIHLTYILPSAAASLLGCKTVIRHLRFSGVHDLLAAFIQRMLKGLPKHLLRCTSATWSMGGVTPNRVRRDVVEYVLVDWLCSPLCRRKTWMAFSSTLQITTHFT